LMQTIIIFDEKLAIILIKNISTKGRSQLVH